MAAGGELLEKKAAAGKLRLVERIGDVLVYSLDIILARLHEADADIIQLALLNDIDADDDADPDEDDSSFTE